MAPLSPQPASSSGRRQHSLKIDMTPMVDLGFLLITSFIFTTTLSQPRTAQLIMPGEGESTGVPASRFLTLLLDKEKAFVYEGLWEESIAKDVLTIVTYNLQSGIGNCIRQNKKLLPKKMT